MTATSNGGTRPRTVSSIAPKRLQQTAKQHAGRFGVDCRHPGDLMRPSLRADPQRYKAWWSQIRASSHCRPFQSSDALAEVFERWDRRYRGARPADRCRLALRPTLPDLPLQCNAKRAAASQAPHR